MGALTAWLIVVTVFLNTVTLFFLTRSVNNLVLRGRNKKTSRVKVDSRFTDRVAKHKKEVA